MGVIEYMFGWGWELIWYQVKDWGGFAFKGSSRMRGTSPAIKYTACCAFVNYYQSFNNFFMFNPNIKFFSSLEISRFFILLIFFWILSLAP